MIRSLAVFLLLCIMAVPAMGKDIKLPEPFAGKQDMQIYGLLEGRSSVLLNTAFNLESISLEDISSILWAAGGLNRPERGWVVPVVTGNVPTPYWKIYALTREGVFLYNYADHQLIQVYSGDVRGRVFLQPQPASAPLILVFVEDGFLVKDIANITANRYASLDIGAVATGAMSQNVYLTAGALNMYTRFMLSINREEARPYFQLDDEDEFLGYMPLWYKGKQ